ncbi:hypothetical protein [Synechococcus sp. RS9916]|uniref:hypothetical protein n=1 Tax=Synechococcus sp. RS9916 TaxID=221359 RepID=UPI0000E53C7B|nr:hypothetical protein [Synechococcus sp. RS9916]EAU73454.1 hypothetical protein RS9916_28124 [Synechococcus sp. RS9916]
MESPSSPKESSDQPLDLDQLKGMTGGIKPPAAVKMEVSASPNHALLEKQKHTDLPVDASKSSEEDKDAVRQRLSDLYGHPVHQSVNPG